MIHQKFDYAVLRRKIFEIIDPKKIISIYIIGSGARNELTFLKNENQVHLSDLEMIVVMRSLFQAFKDQNLYKFCYNNETICEFTKTHIFIFSKSRSPLIYNFKMNGVKIYGLEIRDFIKIQHPSEIHQFEAIKLVYHRIIPFLAELASNPVKNSRNLIYLVCKIYISIAEANSILNGGYSCSYQVLLSNLIKKENKSKRDLITINSLKFKLNKMTFNDYKVPLNHQIFEDVNQFLVKTNNILLEFKPSLIERILNLFYGKKLINRIKSFYDIPIIRLYHNVFSFIDNCIQDEAFFFKNKKVAISFINEWNKIKKIECKF